MLYVEEIRKVKGLIRSLFTGFEPAPVSVRTVARPAAPVRLQQPSELSLSAAQVLVWFASAFSVTGLLLWAVLRLWLFEP